MFMTLLTLLILHLSPRSQTQVSCCHLILLFVVIDPAKSNSFCIPLVPEKSKIFNSPYSVAIGKPIPYVFVMVAISDWTEVVQHFLSSMYSPFSVSLNSRQLPQPLIIDRYDFLVAIHFPPTLYVLIIMKLPFRIWTSIKSIVEPSEMVKLTLAIVSLP